MKEDSKTILIDRYIAGKLEDTELWEFKADLEKDPDLARQVQLRQGIYDTISNEDKMNLLETITKLDKKAKVRRINVHSRQLQAIAASVIILLAIGAGLISNHLNSNLNNRIYSEYFIDEGSDITTRSSSVNGSQVENGIKLYDKKEYNEALSILEQNENNVRARLYAGLSYMNLNKFDEAIDNFEYIILNNDNIFTDQAQWNLGLSYLANDNTQMALETFEKIVSENGAYTKKASEILEKLKNN